MLYLGYFTSCTVNIVLFSFLKSDCLFEEVMAILLHNIFSQFMIFLNGNIFFILINKFDYLFNQIGGFGV